MLSFLLTQNILQLKESFKLTGLVGPQIFFLITKETFVT